MHISKRGCVLCAFALAAGIGGAQNIQSFPAPYSAYNVVNGPDGALWLTPNASSPNGTVGRMTTSGAFSQFTPPGGYFPGGPIVTGPDGNLWLQIFSENQTAIDQLTPSGISTVYALGETDGVYGMTVGSDGAIWLAEGDRIGRITTAGVYTHFLVGNYYPFAITSGSDGNLWFLALNASSGDSVIGQITPAGVSKIFPFSGELPIYSVSPIAAGPDGAIWFTIYATSGAGLAAIGKITTAGVISTYSIPNTSAYNFGESSIAASPDGGLWFTGDGALGRITTTGTATVYPLPAASFSTYAGATGQGLAAGPDGAMWFGV
jgi:virginiamycin B lyase